MTAVASTPLMCGAAMPSADADLTSASCSLRVSDAVGERDRRPCGAGSPACREGSAPRSSGRRLRRERVVVDRRQVSGQRHLVVLVAASPASRRRPRRAPPARHPVAIGDPCHDHARHRVPHRRRQALGQRLGGQHLEHSDARAVPARVALDGGVERRQRHDRNPQHAVPALLLDDGPGAVDAAPRAHEGRPGRSAWCAHRHRAV